MITSFSEVYLMALEMTPRMRQHMLTLLLTSLAVDDFDSMTREQKAAEVARASRLLERTQANAKAANSLRFNEKPAPNKPEPAVEQAEITESIYKTLDRLMK